MEEIITGSDKSYFSGEVLVCDDTPLNLIYICEHLMDVGLVPKVSMSGEDAVKMVKKRAPFHKKDVCRASDEEANKQFDLVFMDIFLPGMDGIEASTKINEIDDNIPIVAFTADNKLNYGENYTDSGIVDYLGKPFEMNDLCQCLTKYLSVLK